MRYVVSIVFKNFSRSLKSSNYLICYLSFFFQSVLYFLQSTFIVFIYFRSAFRSVFPHTPFKYYNNLNISYLSDILNILYTQKYILIIFGFFVGGFKLLKSIFRVFPVSFKVFTVLSGVFSPTPPLNIIII